MSLNSLHLDAFFRVARTLNVSRAAKELHMSQSALTQRIQGLEDDLGLTLFVRLPRGMRLTPEGERLLRYCRSREQLEGDLLRDLKGESSGLGGALRVAAFSTVMRSVVQPALTSLLKEHPAVRPSFFTPEMREIPGYLFRGEADYVVTNGPLGRTDVESIAIFKEENVLVRSRTTTPPDLFLDHDPDDPTTADFLRLQGEDREVERAYLDEIYAIMDGVAAGLGWAVVPKHLAESDSRLEIDTTKIPLAVEVYLHYPKQPFYGRLHEAVLACLQPAPGT